MLDLFQTGSMHQSSPMIRSLSYSFNLIKNMYSNIKSCVSANGSILEYFASTVGVGQGEIFHHYFLPYI